MPDIDEEEKEALHAWRGWRVALLDLATVAAGLALLHVGGCL